MKWIAKLFHLRSEKVTNDLVAIVEQECARQKISNVDLVLAIIKIESDFNPKAARFEKQYTYYCKDEEFSKIQRITLDTERAFQKTSWGPMQIMGGTARWVGYCGWLPDLCNPLVGVIWGLTYFKKVCMLHIYVNDQIACYNAGSVRKNTDGTYTNQDYVNKVIKAMDLVKAEREKYSRLS